MCSPGCFLLQGPILLLSDKAVLFSSLCNPLCIGKNVPEALLCLSPSPLVVRHNNVLHLVPQQVVPSKASMRFSPTLSAPASINFWLFLFLFPRKSTAYFIDSPLSCSLLTCAFAFFYFVLAQAAAAHTPFPSSSSFIPLHHSFPPSSSLMCRRF